ncbi:MAG TPA: exosortase/archaeosortase family protein [Mucilaginibacter sp.]|nr:exosortase/archaeosortase family protein [Mucilaginibacter sp.]
MAWKWFEHGSPVRFVTTFLSLFAAFYFFNIFWYGITTPGNYYNSFLANHLDYIRLLRHLLLRTTAKLLNWMGFASITDDTNILIAGHGRLTLIYSCLGLGIMSFFTAFVLAYPRKWKNKWGFLVCGLIVIQVLNIIRFLVLAIFWDKNEKGQIIDHHTIFNIIIYLIIAVSLYFWVKQDDKKLQRNVTN